jgi:nitrous oxide reductase accessory protein NosL
MFQKVINVGILVLALLSIFSMTALAQNDIDAHRSCAHCGMDRKVFGYSRMLVAYEDASKTGICSLNCAITELNAHRDKKVKSLQVADRDSQRLIDVNKAIWVLGGNKQGVMTSRPKWAFTERAGAKAFIAANGGKIISWDHAMTAATEDASKR